MKCLSKINIFGLKKMVKSGLEKVFLKFLLAQAFLGPTDLLHKWEDFALNYKFRTKKSMFVYMHMINETLSQKCHPNSILSK